MIRKSLFLCAMAGAVWAQEAESGFELRSTVSIQAAHSPDLGEEPRDGAPMVGGFEALLYPTWKLDSHWAISGAIQVHSRPYFPEEFSTQGYGVKTSILNANISYSQFWSKGSLVVRAGQLTSAFGSFLLRYDPASNPLTGVPAGYGYYGNGVAIEGLAGAQVDGTIGPFDMRAQFTNSSPAKRRPATCPPPATASTFNGAGVPGTRTASCPTFRWLTRRFPRSTCTPDMAKCGAC